MKYILFFFSLLFCFQAEAAIKLACPKGTRPPTEKRQTVLRKKKNKKGFLFNLFKKKKKTKRHLSPKKRRQPYPVKIALLAIPISIAIGTFLHPIAYLIGSIIFFAGLIFGIYMARWHPEKYNVGLAKVLLWTGVTVIGVLGILLLLTIGRFD
ncbi:MAG TPA: hypothetical protein ENJ95_22085 [Bacteroidetes bacterium]|nr:hypothetical protein [Bacteroidota bacterium]